jgi:hypothetical protein
MGETVPNRRLVYPAGLLSVYLLAQLLVLAWSAFPAWTMRGPQPRESWAFLAGLDVLLVSWLWPMLRTRGKGLGQAAIEAVLLAAASVPAAVPAINWVDASASQVLAPACCVVGWLLVGMLAVASRPAVRWIYCLLATLANFGLAGLGYLWLEFAGGEVWTVWRLCPMRYATELANRGWPVAFPDRLAGLMPAAVLIVLLALRVLAPGPNPNRPLAPTPDGESSPAGRGRRTGE